MEETAVEQRYIWGNTGAYLTSPKDPPTFPHDRFKRTQIAPAIKHKRQIPDKLVPRVPLVLNHTRETEDPILAERTCYETVLESRFTDDVFADLGEIEEWRWRRGRNAE